MEENKLATREKLKTYFEKGKYPTQSQFSDLVDSLRHKTDILTNDEMVALANNLASIENGFISYNLSGNIKDQEFPIVISSKDREDQVITLGRRDNYPEEKRYFFGNRPYTIQAKEFSAEGLEENEYYVMSSYIPSQYPIARMFGNNLPAIPDGFKFGTLAGDAKNFQMQINKQEFGQKISVINTSIKLVNKTKESIQYRVSTINWSDDYTTEDMVTSHYDLWDDLSIFYRADLGNINQSIECRVYDEDNGNLLTTGYLYAGQNNQDVYTGGQVLKIRNVRIECDYITFED
ncbi:hypothetical protein N6B72_17605 [Chryseobacterium soli]|uniref:hypothetical protein n=1 Tax=Chryseobacterium soli TaxID=445961 RepID=UPI002953D2BF|nr:hypothetical protein [Chryseobacterium soli]MDV7698745.1 hypothetical protein [Chryseobacterium soli]